MADKRVAVREELERRIKDTLGSSMPVWDGHPGMDILEVIPVVWVFYGKRTSTLKKTGLYVRSAEVLLQYTQVIGDIRDSYDEALTYMDILIGGLEIDQRFADVDGNDLVDYYYLEEDEIALWGNPNAFIEMTLLYKFIYHEEVPGVSTNPNFFRRT